MKFLQLSILRLFAAVTLMLSFNAANALGETLMIQQINGNQPWVSNLTFTILFFGSGPKGSAGHVPNLASIPDVLHGTTGVTLVQTNEAWVNHIYMHGNGLVTTYLETIIRSAGMMTRILAIAQSTLTIIILS
ncbi:MAG TPA: hypothetical protein VFW00_01705 [Rhodocyclaceae bacterium]|nr:hypothetical protein [Rhodocyclaceae bacterium]